MPCKEQLYAFESAQIQAEQDMEECRTYALQMLSERDAISDELGAGAPANGGFEKPKVLGVFAGVLIPIF